MSETVYVRGGFSGRTDHLSPHVAARVLEAEAQHDRQVARVEKEREEQLARRQEADVVLSIRMAQERGELVDVRQAIRDGGVGHERSEFVALASARMDVEDAQAEARERAAYRKFLNDGPYGDASAPTPEELVEGELIASRAAHYRAKNRERSDVLRQARALARMDREW